jgi:hypothetical protein
MVEYINSSELNTDIKAYYGDSPATTIIYPRIASFKKDTSLIVVKSKVPHSYITTFVT